MAAQTPVGKEESESPYSNPEPESGKTNPFACNVCKRNYSRVDHLARHYRSHTREKPFICQTCSKAFARADLLKRHSASHSDKRDANRPQNSSPQLARVAQACVACASSKLKCGNERPCHRCQLKGTDCTFPSATEKPRSSSHRSSALKTEPIVDIDTLEGAATLSSMDGQHRVLHFQDSSHQKIAPSTSSGSDFSQDFKGKAVETDPMDSQPTHPMNNAILDIDESPLAGFLRGVMMPTSPNALAAVGAHPMEFIQQNYYNGRDVFQFGMDSSMDFNDMDFGWMNSQNTRQTTWNYGPVPEFEIQRPVREIRAPDVSTGINAGAEAFQKSIWQWKPGQQDGNHAEQANLSLPIKDMQSLDLRSGPDVLDQTLEQMSRDQILAMLLSGCKPATMARIVESFPSAELLNSLMQSFFRCEVRRTDSWIHIPTFRVQSQRPTFNGMVVAAGAVLSGVPAWRKLGFALQEAVSVALRQICDEDNSTTRELQICQTFALELNVGLWSGNKRKMEIAESNLQPLVTMTRRSGRYRRKAFTPPPLPEDDAKTLESKWRAWVEAESFKRLAFHILIHDAQASICLLTRPLISYTEVTLDLPCSSDLWRAKTALEWRDLWLRKPRNISTRLPSLMHCIHEIEPLTKVQDCTDLQFSTLAILHGIWSLVSEYRQLEKVLNENLTTTSRRHELLQILDHFSMGVSCFDGGIPQETRVLQELIMMNLHVSFEELQLFAGKEGPEEAHRVYPLLQQWFDSRQSREAIYYAGQILRAADLDPPNQLRDFYAVALYHSALCFWVYGMCSMGSRSWNQMQDHHLMGGEIEEPLIWLNEEKTAETQRFFDTCCGIPMIDEGGDGCRVDDPRAVMETIIDIMERNCSHGNNVVPPLVENLSQLMRDLGNVASIVMSQPVGGSMMPGPD